MRIHMCCLKVEQEQVQEQSLYIEKIYTEYLNRITGTETIIDVLLAELTDN